MDPQNDIPGVPPPPAEVKVRTMRSDIQSMKMSGGGLPQFQNVIVEGLAMEREIPAAASPGVAAQMEHAQAVPGASSPVAPEASGETEHHASHKVLGIILVIIVTIAAVLAVSYFAYKELWGSGAGSQIPPAGQSTAG